jgi:hypothetical protein
MIEMVVDDPPRQRVLLAPRRKLDEQTLAQIPRAHPGRLQRLDREQRLQHLVGGRAERRGGDLDRRAEMPAVVERADQELRDAYPTLRDVEEMELLEQRLGQRGAGDLDLLEELGIALALRHVRAVEGTVLQILGPVDVVLFTRLGRLLVVLLVGRLLALDVLVLGEIVHLLEHRILHDLLFEDGLQLQRRHLQQLEGLLQALGHDQHRLLGQLQ